MVKVCFLSEELRFRVNEYLKRIGENGRMSRRTCLLDFIQIGLGGSWSQRAQATVSGEREKLGKSIFPQKKNLSSPLCFWHSSLNQDSRSSLEIPET